MPLRLIVTARAGETFLVNLAALPPGATVRSILLGPVAAARDRRGVPPGAGAAAVRWSGSCGQWVGGLTRRRTVGCAVGRG